MKTVLFIMFVLVIAFCFFITNLWQYHGVIDIIGLIATTAGITCLFLGVEE